MPPSPCARVEKIDAKMQSLGTEKRQSTKQATAVWLKLPKPRQTPEEAIEDELGTLKNAGSINQPDDGSRLTGAR
jgi:hypothetical protein